MTKRRVKGNRKRRLSVAEVLESRVLYSADALNGLLPLLVPDNSTEESHPHFELSVPKVNSHPLENTALDGFDANSVDSSAEELGDTRRVVFVDTSIPSSDLIIDSITNDQTRVVVIESDADSLLVISETLAEHSGLESIQIISHGSAGRLDLGATHLDHISLEKNQSAIERWGQALSDNGDILLLGCDVASNATGIAFVEQLAQISGVDVAASTDLTGHTSVGGDWELEYATGTIFDDLAIEWETRQQWSFSLASITVDTTADEFDIPAGTTMTQLLVLQAGGEVVSLREAIHAANQEAGTLDTINLGIGTFEVNIDGHDDTGLRGDFDISDDLEIIGQDFNNTIINASFGNGRVFEIIGSSARFVGVQITGGDHNDEGAGIRGDAGSTVTLVDSLVTNNISNSDGGGIYSAGTLIVENSAISGNEATNNGGGVFALGSVSLTDATVFNNSAGNDGGGIFADSVTVLRSDMGSNTSGDNGGAIHSESTVVINDSNIDDNTAADKGAGVFAKGNVTINNTGFDRNQSTTDSGGAIFGEAEVSVTDAQFDANEAAKQGGAIYSKDSLTLNLTRFSANEADEEGGGVYAEASLVVNDSAFTSNTSNTDGGALWVTDSLTINRSSFLTNTALSGVGGAIYNDGSGTLNITNATLSENAADQAGALYSAAAGNVIQSTFVGNTSNSQAPAIWADGENVVLQGVIFNQNLLNGALVPAVNADVLTAGWNIADFSIVSANGKDLGDTDALLGPITMYSNGVSAYSLLPGSPAINAGIADPGVTTDSVGNSLDEIPDIGAFEYNSQDAVVYWSDDSGSIYRSNVDFTNVQLVIDGRTTPTSIAVGTNQGMLYWLEAGKTTLMSFGMGGNTAVTSLVTGLVDATSISVDTVAAHLYVAHAGVAPRIDRYDLNTGALLQTVVSADLSSPTAILFDTASQRLFWTDQGGGAVTASIRSTDSSGNDLVIYQASASPTSIALESAADRLYWGDDDDDEITVRFLTVAFPLSFSTAPDNDPDSMTYDAVSDRLLWLSDDTNALVSWNADTQAEESRYTHSQTVQEIASAPTSFITPSPVLTTNVSLDVVEGSSSTIDATSLFSEDSDNTADEIVYNVTAGLGNGLLTVDGTANATSFTQDQIDNDLVEYTHDGSETSSDSITFTLSDGTVTTVPYIFNIVVDELNDPPTLTTVVTPVDVTEGSTYTLTASDVIAADVDSANTSFIYRLNALSTLGSIEVGGTTITTSDSFTHAQLVAGQVVYRHGGGEVAADSLGFIVSDGSADSSVAVLSFNILPVNDAPTLTTVVTPVDVTEGGTYTLTASDVIAEDVDSANTSFVYRLNALSTLSSIEVGGTTITTSDSFTHAQLVAGQVVYRHGGGEVAADSLGFIVSDGSADSSVAVLSFNILPVNDAPTLDISVISVPENNPGAEAATVVSADEDTGEILTVEVDDPRFEIQEGILSLLTDQLLDFETEPLVELTVSVTDSFGSQIEELISIPVLDVN
ncbi:MAG: cadherin-like domain-containing protein, partial [Granulosicoccus sp.]